MESQNKFSFPLNFSTKLLARLLYNDACLLQHALRVQHVDCEPEHRGRRVYEEVVGDMVAGGDEEDAIALALGGD